MTTLVWFKRDLRVRDHPALASAARQGAVCPVYIIEPDAWRQSDSSGRHFAFLRESLGDLRQDLHQLGATLCLRVGDAVEVLERLRQQTGARRMVSHEETGNGWSYARDRRVALWARANGVAWEEFAQSGVVRRLNGRDGWAARRNAFVAQPQTQPIRIEAAAPLRSDDIPDLCAPDPCPQRQSGGRRAAEACLSSFLSERGRDYRRAMSSPLTGWDACSRLSPHLALGTLSVREAAQAARARAAQVKGTRSGWSGSIKSFEARLAWRDHFTQKLEDAPRIETQCLHSAYEGMRPRVPDAARLAAWERGETGLPFLDACMRSLRGTGWLNFRMRAMLVSVASYHLWLDWRSTGPHLARLFTDYDPGIHWPQMQMQAGTTGINTPRIYNPVKQGQDQDPDGAFTRRWLPELAEVPDRHLHRPWRWDGAGRLLGRSYPEPIVDVADAARAARDRVWALRKAPGFRSEAGRIVHAHASRKDSAGHFVDDRAQKQRKRAAPSSGTADPRQQGFDF